MRLFFWNAKYFTAIGAAILNEKRLPCNLIS